MYQLRSLFWSLFLWASVFTYSWLTYIESDAFWRALPVSINLLANVILIALYSKDVRNTKSILLSLSWSIVVSIGLLLHIYNMIDEIAFNIHISIMSVIAATVWCITSHAEHVTEAGLHWYIWIMLMILALCAAFNQQSDNAQMVYIIAVSISFASHCYYLWHIFKVQSSGTARCKHVFRVVSCFVLISILLIGSILARNETITSSVWQDTIFIVEFLAAIIIIIDFVVGFSQKTIKYDPLQQEENVP